MVITVLHVDDDEAFLRLTQIITGRLDEEKNLKIISHTDVNQALEILATQDIDIIVSDYQMAPLDGLAFLKLVRDSGNTIPFILVTGRGREEVVIRALNLGATNYLEKGGDPAALFVELIHLINTAVQHKQADEALKQNLTVTKRLLDQQIAINALATKIGMTLDLERVYTTVFEHVSDLMDAYTFIVSIYDEKERMIRAGFVIVEGNKLDASKLPPIPLAEKDSGTQSRVIHSGKFFYSPDIRKPMSTSKTSYKIESDGSVMEGTATDEDDGNSKSSLLVPMKVGGSVVGVMQVQSLRYDAYNSNDIELLSALANVAALGIQNAMLFKDRRENG